MSPVHLRQLTSWSRFGRHTIEWEELDLGTGAGWLRLTYDETHNVHSAANSRSEQRIYDTIQIYDTPRE